VLLIKILQDPLKPRLLLGPRGQFERTRARFGLPGADPGEDRHLPPPPALPQVLSELGQDLGLGLERDPVSECGLPSIFQSGQIPEYLQENRMAEVERVVLAAERSVQPLPDGLENGRKILLTEAGECLRIPLLRGL